MGCIMVRISFQRRRPYIHHGNVCRQLAFWLKSQKTHIVTTLLFFDHFIKPWLFSIVVPDDDDLIFGDHH